MMMIGGKCATCGKSMAKSNTGDAWNILVNHQCVKCERNSWRMLNDGTKKVFAP